MVNEDLLNKKPRRMTEVWKNDENTGLVVAIGNLEVIYFNPLGSFIWHLVDGKTNVRTIIEKICEKYNNIEPKKIETDVEAFFKGIEQQRLIVFDWSSL